ncbi:phage tail protein [Hymenobacter psychrotolerans]|uniref:Microcystin-dependent protein n=1 Tax=Hymenobacter psychrotolerans DSM 18569 TaxID=1121959 RepID=A0A1M6QEH4_9BACT|nr:tail fiber protein [Hymenobacter psychrotolerans]SHK18714.1 Microcystin-dependent protein [Hymenobacter psychrotolerans DSM 18569]
MRLIATPAGIVPSSSHAHQAEPERRGWLKRLGALLGGTLLAGTAAAGTRGAASVQGEYPYLGEIIMFAGTYPPRGYAFCDGQILSIAQNTALFSLLGTTYGGNGQTTFALPDLRGRLPMHNGQGPGLSPHTLGEIAGTENVTLTFNQMPAHNHTATATQVTTSPGNTNNPSGALLANDGAGGTQYATGVASNASMAGAPTIGIAGGNQPHPNMPPYLCINFCIALEGIYPSRN